MEELNIKFNQAKKKQLDYKNKAAYLKDKLMDKKEMLIIKFI